MLLIYTFWELSYVRKTCYFLAICGSKPTLIVQELKSICRVFANQVTYFNDIAFHKARILMCNTAEMRFWYINALQRVTLQNVICLHEYM